ncbi:MAG: hypothetical protein ACFFC7_32680 [Candidatus Hermodarchaeota archaeon]
MVYLWPASMFLMFVAALWLIYAGNIFYYYFEEYYPKEAKERKKYRLSVTGNPLYTEYDKSDPEFRRLHKRAKNAYRLFVFSLFLPVLLMIGFFIKSFLFGS